MSALPPKSGRVRCNAGCPLSANSGHLSVTTRSPRRLARTSRVGRRCLVAVIFTPPPPYRRPAALLAAPAALTLPPHSNAIDAAICIATGVMTDRSARHWTRPEHDAGPRHATGRIRNVLAVNHGPSRRWTESDTCKRQHEAGRNSRNCHWPSREILRPMHGDPPYRTRTRKVMELLQARPNIHIVRCNMLTWINAGCDVGLGLPKCQAMHPTSVLGQKQTSAVHWAMSAKCQ